MKVNTIPSFGRIIKINSDSYNPEQNKKIDNSTYEIGRILNSEPSKKYSNQQAKSIREFFKSVLGDYNGQNGILLRRTDNGDVFLLSGREAHKVHNIEKRTKYMGEKRAQEIIKQIYYKAVNPEYSIEFKTGHKTKNGFSVFNEILYSRTKLTYGTRIDGTIQENHPDGKKMLCGIDYEQQSLKI